jgi:hypothetical protein
MSVLLDIGNRSITQLRRKNAGFRPLPQVSEHISPVAAFGRNREIG